MLAAALLTVPAARNLGAAGQENGQQALVNVTPMGRGALDRGTADLKGMADLQRSGPLQLEEQQELRVRPNHPGHSIKDMYEETEGVWSTPGLSIPNPRDERITFRNPRFSGFNGLTHLDQRLAGGGTQFDTEPPDQGLCVGNGFVLETVNTALAAFTEDGKRVAGPTTFNSFFNLPPEFDRGTRIFGPSLTDPRCLFDAASDRFFVTILEFDVDPNTGDFLPSSHLLIAVSATGDPTGDFNLFSIDATEDGNFATGPRACPCFGDQPLIGANADGLFISTNAFSLITSRFAGAQIYALGKAALAAGKRPVAVRFNNLVVPGGFAFSIQPAFSPPERREESGKRGTEFFASIFDIRLFLENKLVVWALEGTRSLGSATPRLRLRNRVIKSQVFGLPPDATQKAGPTPLGDLVRLAGEDPIETIATNDHRMQQVMFTHGKLFTAVTTIVGSPVGSPRSGIAFFIIEAELEDEGVEAEVEKQGYVAVSDHFLMYPSFGVNPRGEAAIVFSLSGPNFFPSVGFVQLDGDGHAGRVHIAAAGAAPEDGLTGYEFDQAGDLNTPRASARWGDYSAAVVGEDGSIWLAAEFIPNAPRTLLANWGTFVGRLRIEEK